MADVNIESYLTPEETIRWAILQESQYDLIDLKYNDDDDMYDFDRDPLEDDDVRRERVRQARERNKERQKQYRLETEMIRSKKMDILVAALARIETNSP